MSRGLVPGPNTLHKFGCPPLRARAWPELNRAVSLRARDVTCWNVDYDALPGCESWSRSRCTGCWWLPSSWCCLSIRRSSTTLRAVPWQRACHCLIQTRPQTPTHFPTADLADDAPSALEGRMSVLVLVGRKHLRQIGSHLHLKTLEMLMRDRATQHRKATVGTAPQPPPPPPKRFNPAWKCSGECSARNALPVPIRRRIVR